MILVVYGAIYLGLIVFVIGCLGRIYEYSRTPMHLRWELYPVPHEARRYAVHGGSYFESANWFAQPQEHHPAGDWAAMLEEIFLLKSLREHNPRLWLSSLLFHAGIYVAIAAVVLLALGTALTVAAPSALVAAGLLRVATWAGLAGAALIVVGAVLLLIRRLLDPGLRNYTKPGDLFNLMFFVATFVLLGAGWLSSSPQTATMGGVARGMVGLDRTVTISPLLGIGLILASALTAYIPFTHMSHFIAKYFAWHAVRWDDRRMERGSAAEKQIAENLQFRPTWAAKHVGADGQKNWADIAASAPPEEVRK